MYFSISNTYSAIIFINLTNRPKGGGGGGGGGDKVHIKNSSASNILYYSFHRYDVRVLRCGYWMHPPLLNLHVPFCLPRQFIWMRGEFIHTFRYKTLLKLYTISQIFVDCQCCHIPSREPASFWYNFEMIHMHFSYIYIYIYIYAYT